MRIIAICLALILALRAPLGAQSAAAASILQNVPVPMRDGVILRADVLRPAGDGPFPVLVYRTPYGKDRAIAAYSLFRKAAERGYAVVLQDVRGRYASDGEYGAYELEEQIPSTIGVAASQLRHPVIHGLLRPGG